MRTHRSISTSGEGLTTLLVCGHMAATRLREKEIQYDTVIGS